MGVWDDWRFFLPPLGYGRLEWLEEYHWYNIHLKGERFVSLVTSCGVAIGSLLNFERMRLDVIVCSLLQCM
jgi:hypothetical protein